jgi:uncharacterized membrane protein YedE/YeeE
MMEWLTMESWSPYAVGIGIGVLSWISFLLSDAPISCSTAFARSGGMLERLFRGKKVLERDYYKKFAPEIEWGWMLVVGVIIGSFISASLSGSFQWQWIAEPTTRVWVAFAGGMIMGFASRWTGGCTSGHGISGTLQLVVSSWITVVCIFAGGIAVTFLIHR